MGDDDSDLVWSSDQGDLRGSRKRQAGPMSDRPGSGRRAGRSSGRAAGRKGGGVADSPPGPAGRVRVRREVAGRRGKAVTTVTGVSGSDRELRRLAKDLKQRCGVGGTAKNGTIELQGDHRDVVLETLKRAGFDAVSAGG